MIKELREGIFLCYQKNRVEYLQKIQDNYLTLNPAGWTFNINTNVSSGRLLML